MTTLNTEIRSSFPRIIATGTGKDFPKLAESKVCHALVKALLTCEHALIVANTPQFAGRIEAAQAHSLAKLAIRSALNRYADHQCMETARHYIDARSKSFEVEVE